MTSASLATFWTSFWPALGAGVIASLLTGAFVGLALLLIQRHMEGVAARRAYMRELSLMTQQLCDVISRPNPFIITNAVSSTPEPAKAAMQVIQRSPISLWRDQLNEQRALLDALHQLQVAYSDFQSRATTLDFHLNQFTRRFNSARNAIAANDPEVHSFCFGRLCGFQPEKLLPWLDLQLTPPEWLQPAFDEVAADEQIVAAHAAYLQSRQRLEQAFQSLAQRLRA